MAKPPCARLTKPMSPIVIESPTDTMNSTMPAATPPRTMPARSTPRITRRLPGRAVEKAPPPPRAERRAETFGDAELRGSVPGARPDLLLLARVLHGVDLSDGLLR